MEPSSPRGWLNYSVSVLERYERPHSQKFEYHGRTDPRISDKRETALSVSMIAERASHSVSGNGRGYALMTRYFCDEASWYSFSDPEKFVLEKTIRVFRRELQKAGFLPP